MDLVQDLKSQVSITDVVARYRPLHKAGKNFKALCPFHDDHSPSMIINPSQNFAWCFACQNGGDIFAFVQKMEGIDFPESVRLIAEIAGVDSTEFFKNQTPESAEKNKEKKEYSERLREVLTATNEFFLENFEKNEEAKKYVFEVRKFSAHTQKQFSLGYAPDDFQKLEAYLLSRKFSRKEMLDAGVVKQSDKNPEKIYDRFRKRVMFPFYDAFGKICGFGGRILGEGDPKYLNSPETQLYDKSKNLYGFSAAKDFIRKKNMAVLVEGNLDVMTCHELGIPLAVGVSGVGFSVEQAKLLKRFCTRVTLALDADNAGMKASERILEVLLQEKFSVRMMEIPGGKDPDESLREDKQKFIEALVGADNAIEVVVARLSSQNNISTAEGKRKIFDTIFPLIAKIPENIEKNEALSMVAKSLKTSLGLIEESFRSFFSQQHSSYSPPAEKKSGKKEDEFSQLDFFWGVIFAYFSESGKIFEMIQPEFFLEKEEKNLYEHLQFEYNAQRTFSAQDFIQKQERKWQEKMQKSILFVEDKLINLPKNQRKTEISRVALSFGQFLLGQRIKECSQKLKTAPSPEEVAKLQFYSTALRKFHI